MGFTIVEEEDFFRVTMTGVLSSRDMVDLVAAADVIEHGRDPVPHRLVDLRAVTDLEIRYADVSGFAEARRGKRFPNAFKSAIVVGNAAQAGMARMFRTLSDNPQILVEIFEDDTAAIAWLRA